jgi:UDP-glucose 4-epimerase
VRSTSPSSNGRALVWGGRGFIGRQLVAELLRRGRDVAVVTRRRCDPDPAWASRVVWHELNRGSRQVWAEALADAAVVYNLAGSSGAVASNRSPRQSLDAICAAQLEFLDACAASPGRPHVVFASSRLVYAPAGTTPIAEDGRLGPRSMYAAHKLCVEHYHQIYARASALTYTIARISNPFGLDDEAALKSHGIVNAMIERARRGLPLLLFGGGEQQRDYIYITDLIDGLIRCGEHVGARNEIFNLGQGRSVSMRAAALLITQRIAPAEIASVPWPAEYEAVESGDYVVDVTKAAARLAFTPHHTLASGLDEIAAATAGRAAAMAGGVFAAVRHSA